MLQEMHTSEAKKTTKCPLKIAESTCNLCYMAVNEPTGVIFY